MRTLDFFDTIMALWDMVLTQEKVALNLVTATKYNIQYERGCLQNLIFSLKSTQEVKK